MWVDVGAVNRSVTICTPTCTLHHASRVWKVADGQCPGSGKLGVAFQAQIVVTLSEHLFVDRTMYVVTARASFSKRLMHKHVRAGLLAVTLRARLILARNENSFRVVDVLTMWVVAIGAAHPTFSDRMMVLEIE